MAHSNTVSSKSVAEIVTDSERKFADTTNALDSMVQAINGIATSSEKVSKIIKVIDEIAFQTNILALNAAVEAARAGEAGMGFAVVADEVRSLAQRSAEAAKQTTALIEESITSSTNGKAKVDEVVVLMRDLAQQSSNIKVLVDAVSLGSEEQSRGIEQITKTVGEMQTVTRSSAATAEESAAAAEELAGQSEALRRVVGHLRTMVGDSATNLENQL
jgi:methyl-accepting chemotaxis protein